MKYYLLCVCLWITCIGKTQTFSPLDLKKANKQHEIVACERQIFGSNSSFEQNKILLIKAKLYRELGDYSNAIRSLDRLSSNITKETDYEILNERLINNFQIDSMYTLSNYLNEVKTKFPDSLNNKIIFYMHCMALANEFDSDSLSKTIKNFIFKNKINRTNHEVDSILQRPHLKNTNRAKLFSYVLPGSGQIYAGKWNTGLFSLSLNASFLAYTIYCINTTFYANALITGFSFLSTFYKGGVRYSEKLVLRYNETQKKKYKTDIENYVYLLIN